MRPGYPRAVPGPLNYEVVERERRYLLARLPDGVTSTKEIVDRYVTGTRLRLREVRESDGTVVRKLGHKVRLTEGPDEIACTNFYLVPDWLDVVRDVTRDEAWTGGRLAR